MTEAKPKKISRLRSWINRRWPLMWRKTHRADRAARAGDFNDTYGGLKRQHAQEIEALKDKHLVEKDVLKKRHHQELKDERRTVREIVERLSRTDWACEGSRYGLQLSFDDRMFSGGAPYPGCEREREMLAEEMGRRVEREIKTCHFVQAAYQNDIAHSRRAAGL